MLHVPCWALLTFENICKLCDIDLSFSVIKYSTKSLNERQIKREEQAIEQTWYFDFACNVVRVLNKFSVFKLAIEIHDKTDTGIKMNVFLVMENYLLR